MCLDRSQVGSLFFFLLLDLRIDPVWAASCSCSSSSSRSRDRSRVGSLLFFFCCCSAAAAASSFSFSFGSYCCIKVPDAVDH